MLPTYIRAVLDELRTRDDRIALLRHASAEMEILRKKQKLVESGDTQVKAPVLAKEFAIIVPLINEYYADLHGWFEALKTLRNTWNPKQKEWQAMQVLARAAYANYSQYTRRTLAGQAADTYQAKHGAFKRGQRSKYMEWIKKTWTERREAAEKIARQNCGLDHLPWDDREDVIDKLWEQVKQEIEHGQKLEPPPGLLD